MRTTLCLRLLFGNINKLKKIGTREGGAGGWAASSRLRRAVYCKEQSGFQLQRGQRSGAVVVGYRNSLTVVCADESVAVRWISNQRALRFIWSEPFKQSYDTQRPRLIAVNIDPNFIPQNITSVYSLYYPIVHNAIGS